PRRSRRAFVHPWSSVTGMAAVSPDLRARAGRLLERVEGPGTPLGGADLFHVRTDAELARRGTNVCVLLATLEGRIDVPALRARLAEGPPELRWRLGRGLRHPWLWRPDGPGAVLVERR